MPTPSEFLPLGIVDILVLLLAVSSSLLVGLRFRGRNRSVESFLLGDRDLPWWAILGSIVATETSTATVLSIPGHGFGDTGLKFLQLAAGFVVGRCLVVSLLLPRYFQGRLVTAYETLGLRFGAATKRWASLLFIITRNLGDGLRLFLAAMVLEKLAGWPIIPSAAVIGSITIVYTYYGGMRSVVWNDCIQFVIYILGSLAAVWVIADQLPDGWSEFYHYLQGNPKTVWIDGRFSLSDPYTLWAGLIGGAMLSLGSHGTDQMMVQRYLSARSQPDAARAIVLSGVVVFAQFALFLVIGLLLDCFYRTQGQIPNVKNDEIFVHFMIHSFPRDTGLVGLMLAAILAAAMSTLSSSLSASASSVVGDLWYTHAATPLDADRQLAVTRWLTVAFGILQIGLGIWASSFDESVVANALTIAGFSSGILLGIFALAIFTRHTSQRDALAGAFCGILCLLLIQFALPYWGFRLAFPWLPCVGAATTFIPGYLLSRYSSDRPAEDCHD